MTSFYEKSVRFRERASYSKRGILKNYSPFLMRKSPTSFTSYRYHTDEEDSTMHLDYPPTKPFINDDYERPPYKPVSSYPEGNRKAVISALRNLQGKIHQLEVERTAAEDNLKSLASETNKYKDILERDSETKKPAQTTVSKHNQELESQLSAAETRCNLLEKQLEYMKNMVVSNTERDRVEAFRKSRELETSPDPMEEHSSGFQNNLRKIADLEREHIKLTANQSLAESKIRELEEKLGDERHHRKLIVEKAAEIESVQKANRILQEADDVVECKTQQKSKRPVKKKKKVVSRKTGHSHKPDPSKHYRLNLADIPFVAGKNTGPSHSVGANVQRVFSLMKNHNMALCSHASYPVSTCQQTSPSSSGTTTPSTETDLAEILLQLQDEFHQMSFEHQEFSKEISEASDPRVREDLERELDALVTRMEAKSLQISKIRKHQEKIAHKKKKKSRKIDNDEFSTPRSKSAHGTCVRASPSPRYNGEVEVTTTIKPRGCGTGVVQIRPTSAREISLNVLKDMKKLQSTLRKDDLSWK
ncbi:centrosomal protein of 57 kDa-like isoform X2 [Ruditapes philippinarum]|uniref:centrosomal protein of 57 kDa-like isoform X2 n=1 Tax=Ruditapes philippinarum TaxID=129788 RepID=UPI00295B13B9|nr:centrosomal protein of 57 kDa-like isoform X2 [Ruditapes philippinarum]